MHVKENKDTQAEKQSNPFCGADLDQKCPAPKRSQGLDDRVPTRAHQGRGWLPRVMETQGYLEKWGA